MSNAEKFTHEQKLAAWREQVRAMIRHDATHKPYQGEVAVYGDETGNYPGRGSAVWIDAATLKPVCAFVQPGDSNPWVPQGFGERFGKVLNFMRFDALRCEPRTEDA